mmetsp:Transcript_8248/g.13347  ORF Transcript_8248/g.13347 Transcript_8248/m.13347 type:complete len:250 (-) Transcript_8248:388-1137(-)
MHLIAKSQRVVLFCEKGDIAHGSNRPFHRIYTFKSNNFVFLNWTILQQSLQVVQVVVLVDLTLPRSIADPLNHARVVVLVGEKDRIWQHFAHSRQCCLICNITTGEHQSSFLPMQACEFLLQKDVVVVCSRDVSRTTSTRPTFLSCIDHCANNLWVLSHRQVVIAAPASYLHFLPVRWVMTVGNRKVTCLALEIRKNPVPSLFLDRFDLLGKQFLVVVVHRIHTRSMALKFRLQLARTRLTHSRFPMLA